MLQGKAGGHDFVLVLLGRVGILMANYNRSRVEHTKLAEHVQDHLGRTWPGDPRVDTRHAATDIPTVN
jgi:hypothetical protein